MTSFANGQTIRELRLTNDEVMYVRKIYPYAEIKLLSNQKDFLKKWYEINITTKNKKSDLVKL